MSTPYSSHIRSAISMLLAGHCGRVASRGCWWRRCWIMPGMFAMATMIVSRPDASINLVVDAGRIGLETRETISRLTQSLQSYTKTLTKRPIETRIMQNSLDTIVILKGPTLYCPQKDMVPFLYGAGPTLGLFASNGNVSTIGFPELGASWINLELFYSDSVIHSISCYDDRTSTHLS